MIQVDYSKDDSIKQALAGVHVVISTIQPQAIDVQTKVAAAGKEVGVQLFCPSEFGGISENETEGIFAAKAAMQERLKAMGVPYAAFYNGPFSDMTWIPCVSLIICLPLAFGTIPSLVTKRQGQQVYTTRCLEWECVRRWRRQQATFVHLQT